MIKKDLTNKKTPLKKGESIELEVTALDEDGFGIGIADTCQIKVRRALPGERVAVKVEHAGQHKIVARLTKILRPAGNRCKSPCRHMPECDGCPLIELGYTAQLSWKENRVANHIRRYKELDQAEIHPVIPSPRQLLYRNSAKLVIGGRFTAPIIGIYRRESHDILDISDCPLHHPLINRIVSVVKQCIIKNKIPIYHPRSGQGLLRYLVVRVAEAANKAMVVFVTSRRSFNELHHLAAFVRKEVPEAVVVVQNVNSSAGNVIMGDRDYFLSKQTTLEASLSDIKFLISPRSFFQVNSGSATIIYELVRKYSGLTGRENVLDLYCGIGAISLFLAPMAKNVHGIEVVEAAVIDAAQNARINRLGNCSYEAGDVVEQLKWIVESRENIDLVVLNPPRKGCDGQVLRQVTSLKAPKIIYVSCSPDSLARDLVTLYSAGYLTRFIQPVDMFPQTTHVESIAVLELRPE